MEDIPIGQRSFSEWLQNETNSWHLVSNLRSIVDWLYIFWCEKNKSIVKEVSTLRMADSYSKFVIV